VMNRRHVNEEAARKSDVACDARAFLAERLFGDLDDDVLTGFQHFGNELRTAWRTRMAMSAIMPGTTGTAWTAFESRATAGTSTMIGTTTTAVWTTAAATIASAALRALETSAGIAADASGITREIFARGGRSADARGASFAGKENDIVFDSRGWGDEIGGGGPDYFRFGVFLMEVGGIADGRGVLGAFMRGVGFEFGTIGGAACFDFGGFFLGEFGFRSGPIFGSVHLQIVATIFFLPFLVARILVVRFLFLGFFFLR
ncbi:MAG: hypothetical protein ACREQ5_29220, partial [Candidatus Dormibacteria bacterium]